MSPEPVVHIVDGELADDAVAALTSVLVALAGHRARPEVLPATWRRRDAASDYLSPASWRS